LERHRGPLEEDLPRVRRDEPGHEPEERTLAASTLAEQHGAPLPRDVERQRPDRGTAGEAPGHLSKRQHRRGVATRGGPLLCAGGCHRPATLCGAPWARYLAPPPLPSVSVSGRDAAPWGW